MESRNDELYTSCFCEENIWNFSWWIKELRRLHLSDEEVEITLREQLSHLFHVNSIDCAVSFSSLDFNDMYVIFISNNEKKVPIWNQKNGSDDSRIAIWDYHVVALKKAQRQTAPSVSTTTTTTAAAAEAAKYSDSLIFDFDSSLPFPTSALSYIEECFLPAKKYPIVYHPIFRIISAVEYLSIFASDRSHMLIEGEDKRYVAKPPSYVPIRTDKSAMNLPDFISMDSNWIPSQIKTLDELIEWIHT